MTYHTEMFLPVPLERTRMFFSDVHNLKRITPPFPLFTISGPSAVVRNGSRFPMELNFILFRVRWVSVIEAVDDDGSFTDTSSGALFPRWRHSHIFRESRKGSIVIDNVVYTPAWWFAPVAPVALRCLFLYRKTVLRGLLR